MREQLGDLTQDVGPATLPPGIRVVRDVAYGDDPRQRFDVYAPAHASRAPVILMVHGGSWRYGDKAMRGVIEAKIARWVPRGFIVISTNYRMLPDTAPLQQAMDVARALALAQRRASEWGGDAHRFVLMGHSAGAHLVALLTAEPDLAREQGAAPWLGTVSLDSASLDMMQTMQRRHLPLYDHAFGDRSADWLAASPYQQMHGQIVPFLAVCSSRRRDSCPQAHAFADKSGRLGSHATVLEEDLSHEAINQQLGLPSDYTSHVEAFLRSLDPAMARLLDERTRSLSALPVVINTAAAISR
jgi:acetyl esterase/lipase